MVDKDTYHIGAMHRSDKYKKQLALKSLRHCSDDEQFVELFPELKQEIDEKLTANPEKYEAADDSLIVTEDKLVATEERKSRLYPLVIAAIVFAVSVLIIAFT